MKIILLPLASLAVVGAAALMTTNSPPAPVETSTCIHVETDRVMIDHHERRYAQPPPDFVRPPRPTPPAPPAPAPVA